MPASIEFLSIGDPELKAAVQQAIEAAVEKLRGSWRISLIGSQSNDTWELKVCGRDTKHTFKLYGTEGQHEPRFIKDFLVARLSGPTSSTSRTSRPKFTEADAWQNLSHAGGTGADVPKVLKMLAEMWAIPPNDPRKFDQFVMRHGVDQKKKVLSADELKKFRADFQKESRECIDETRNLIRGVTHGPLTLAFFSGLNDLSSPLKRVAYTHALQAASGENRLMVLCALGREAQNFIQECISAVPGDISIDVFERFIRNSARALNEDEGDEPESKPTDTQTGLLERLLLITSLPITAEHERVLSLPNDERENMIRAATRLLSKLPPDSFGKFLRMRFSAFLYLANANTRFSSFEQESLTASGEPAVIDLLALTGGIEAVVSTLSRLSAEVRDEQAEFLGRGLDFVRKHSARALDKLADKLEIWAKSKSLTLSTAALAALVELGQANPREFERTFLRSTRSQVRVATAWLVKNPEVVKNIKIGRLPRAIWKEILRALTATKPELAEEFINAKLKTSDSLRYWQDSVEILASSENIENERILNQILSSHIREGLGLEQLGMFSRDPVRSLIKQRFWKLSEKLPQNEKLQLLLSVGPLHEDEVVGLLQRGFSGPDADNSRRALIIEYMLPILLEQSSLSPTFGRAVQDKEFKQEGLKALSEVCLNSWSYLKKFPEDWRSARNGVKTRIHEQVKGGIQTALLNIRADSPLHSGVQHVSDIVEKWAKSDSPALRGEFNVAGSHGVPGKMRPDRATLDDFFRHQPEHPHSLALFFGSNPWAVDYAVNDRGILPHVDILLEQVCKSFIFLADLRKNALREISNIEESVAIDLAINIRSILSDIESEISPYFALRDALNQVGIEPVSAYLGAVLKDSNAPPAQYRVIRQPGRPGRLRLFSSGIKVGRRIVDTAIVTQSGTEDDRD